MGRIIGAAVLGYLTIFLLVITGLTGIYLAMGPDRAFKPESFDVSTLWLVVHTLIGFGAAVFGGRVALGIARGPRGPRALAGVVVVLGLVLALPAVFTIPEAPGPRDPGLGAMDAMMQAQTPPFVMLFQVVIGAVGVLLGGKLLGQDGASPAA